MLSSIMQSRNEDTVEVQEFVGRSRFSTCHPGAVPREGVQQKEHRYSRLVSRTSSWDLHPTHAQDTDMYLQTARSSIYASLAAFDRLQPGALSCSAECCITHGLLR
jgi:hypothetical protein